MTKRISIADQFTRSPAGRNRSDGPFSGERFREEILWPTLRESEEPVLVDFDGVFGFGSSFLEEAFGGLVRNSLISKAELSRRLQIHSTTETYKRRVLQYIDDARPVGK